jgi:hypothetical protein
MMAAVAASRAVNFERPGPLRDISLRELTIWQNLFDRVLFRSHAAAVERQRTRAYAQTTTKPTSSFQPIEGKPFLARPALGLTECSPTLWRNSYPLRKSEEGLNACSEWPDSEPRIVSISGPGEFRNHKDTSNSLISSVVWVSNFATDPISAVVRPRNPDTSRGNPNRCKRSPCAGSTKHSFWSA